jgi:D-amino-acid dehydrogenase
MNEHSRVIVVGGGVVGLCCATYIQRSGRSVTLIDKLEPGDPGAASFGNAGSISWSSCIPTAVPGLLPKVPGWLFRRDSPLTIRWRHLPTLAPWLWRFVRAGSEESVVRAAAALSMLHSPAMELHTELAKTAGVPELIQECGYLHLYTQARADRLTQLEWRLRSEHGARLELLDQEDVAEKEPQLARRYPQAVNIVGQGYIGNPSRLLRAYADTFISNGGEIVQDEVTGFERSDARVTKVLTSAGPLGCTDVVIAAGPWSRTLVKMLGFDIPLDTERGYHISVAESGLNIRHTLMETDEKFVVTPMETGVRFAGTVELANVDAPPDYRRADMILNAAKRMFPTIRAEQVTKWMGRRPSLPDGLPVVGRAPGYNNVYMAFGHAHTGMVAAPATGKIVAALIENQPINADLRPFRAERF